MKDDERIVSPRMAAMSGMTPCLLKLTAFFLVGLLFLPFLVRNSNNFHRFILSPEDVTLTTETNPRPVESLIHKIREAVQKAAVGQDISFSADDRKAWEERNPCTSRLELKQTYERRKHVKDVAVNREWETVLAEYAVLHRVCMSKIGDPKAYFSAQNQSTGCKFLIAEAHYGLGNKLLHMSSLFLYSVLTQRVMLIPRSTSVPPILCEPFAGSSWSIADDLLHLVQSHRLTSDQLYEALDSDRLKKEKLTPYASMGGGIWGPEIRFWCDTEQAFFSTVTWLTFDGCLQFLPKLFAIASFRPMLEALFPVRIVLTHILRSVMLPADPVWERVLDAKAVYLDNAEKQVGVQVRFLHGANQYKTDGEFINDQITKCMWENSILPELCPDKSLVTDNSKFENCSSSVIRYPPAVTKVLVASLFFGFNEHLSKVYLRQETTTGEAVGVVQLTHEKTQGSGIEVDSQALVEIITLSFSDVLLITPFSTFGGVAHGYGGLTPYFIQYHREEGNHCQRGLSIEPCYLGAIPNYDCHYDDPKQRPVEELVPYLRRCPTIDVGGGPNDGTGMLLYNRD